MSEVGGETQTPGGEDNPKTREDQPQPADKTLLHARRALSLISTLSSNSSTEQDSNLEMVRGALEDEKRVLSKTGRESSNFIPKDGRELLHQLDETHYGKEALKIIEESGYDDATIRAKLESMAQESPDEYKAFLWSLRGEIRQSESEISNKFSAFDTSHPEDESYEARRLAIQEKVFRIGAESNPESARKEILEAFPSGNYLVHGTNVEGALAVIGDGQLKSMAERRNGGSSAKGKGGYYGISFSYDGVGAIPGNPRHMVALITSPEMALNDKSKLTVPYYAAENEVQYVPVEYDRQTVAQVESQSDFLGITMSSLMSEVGVISDYTNLNDSLESGKGGSHIEVDLNKIKAGDIKIEGIQSRYSYENGNFRVNPNINEGEINAGTIYADFLLRHTEVGKALGKTLENITPQELMSLKQATEDETKAIFKGALSLRDRMNAYGGISIPLENQVMLVPDNDLERYIDVLARSGHSPKAIMVYSQLEGPRIPNWRAPEGHNEKAKKVITTALSQAGVTQPSLPYDAILGKTTIPEDITGVSIKYLKWDAIADASDVVKATDGTITIKS